MIRIHFQDDLNTFPDDLLADLFAQHPTASPLQPCKIFTVRELPTGEGAILGFFTGEECDPEEAKDREDDPEREYDHARPLQVLWLPCGSHDRCDVLTERRAGVARLEPRVFSRACDDQFGEDGP